MHSIDNRINYFILINYIIKYLKNMKVLSLNMFSITIIYAYLANMSISISNGKYSISVE